MSPVNSLSEQESCGFVYSGLFSWVENHLQAPRTSKVGRSLGVVPVPTAVTKGIAVIKFLAPLPEEGPNKVQWSLGTLEDWSQDSRGYQKPMGAPVFACRRQQGVPAHHMHMDSEQHLVHTQQI